MHCARQLSVVATLAIVGALAARTGHAADTDAKPALQPIHFGVLPAADSATMHKQFAPLLAEVEKALHRPMTLVVVEDYADILHQLLQQEVHIGLISPYIYVNIQDDVQRDVLVQVRRVGQQRARGVCVVKAEAPYKTMRDVAGKRIAFVDQASTSGYLFARLAMRKLGIDSAKHFAESTFAGAHDKAVAALLAGDVDVACLSQQTIANNKSVRTILETDFIPDDVILARRGVNTKERDTIRRLLLSGKSNPGVKAFMQAAGIEAFVAPDLAIYAALKADVAKM